MKKITDIEMKFYEFLEIKKFKKFVLFVLDKRFFLSNPNLTKEERKKLILDTASNYNIGKDRNLNSLHRYKMFLYLNTSIHLIPFIVSVFYLPKIIFSNLNSIIYFILIILEMINTYCLILQRYNCIRINKTIKRMITKQELEEKKLKEELIEKDSLLEEHTYKVIDELNIEKTITFKELLDKADINTLKEYRKYLAVLQENVQNNENNACDLSFPIEDSKGVRLVLKYEQDR